MIAVVRPTFVAGLLLATLGPTRLPGQARPPQRLAEGIFFLDDRGEHVAWVDLGSDVLAIVPPSSASALQTIRRRSGKPIRAVFAPNGWAGGARSGPLELVPAGRGPAGAGVGFRGSVTVGARGVEIRELERAVSAGNGVVYLADSGVLFAGDLVGDGAVIDSTRSEPWIQVLERLERLQPKVVVPGRGPVGDVELLRRTREMLIAARAHARDGITRRRPIEEIASTSPTPALARHVARELVGLVPPSMIDELELRPGPSFTRQTPGWMPPRIVVVQDMWPDKPGRISELAYLAPGVEIRVPDSTGQLLTMIADADAFLGPPTAAAFRAATRLRWIQSPSAGVEGPLTIPGLADGPVVLTNAQKIYAPPLLEHAFGLILGLTRKLQVAVPLMRERSWQDDPKIFPPAEMPELRGKTLLVAGLGGIGTEVATLGHALGMRVIATRNNKSRPTEIVEYVGGSAELATLAAQADVVVDALPLTPATRNVFNQDLFRVMKKSAYFINIGRGGTVDTEALTQALEAGQLAGVGLDVTAPEPLPATHRLWTLPNVIITPHVGSSSDWERERTWWLYRENLRRYVAGEPLLSVVDKKAAY